mgnify:CR=1 FL=1
MMSERGERPNRIIAANQMVSAQAAGGRTRAAQMKGVSNLKTPLPTEASTPCLEGESRHWLAEGGYVNGVREGRCKNCRAVRTWTLDPIASVVPQSYERDGAEYLARLR